MSTPDWKVVLSSNWLQHGASLGIIGLMMLAFVFSRSDRVSDAEAAQTNRIYQIESQQAATAAQVTLLQRQITGMTKDMSDLSKLLTTVSTQLQDFRDAQQHRAR